MLAIEAIGIAAILGLPFNTFTTTIVVLTVGLGVDYDAHIAHHFLLQSGSTSTERVGRTMRYIGSAVFHAAVSTLLGLAVASASSTEVVRSAKACSCLVSCSNYACRDYFADMLALVTFISLLNGLILLPLILTVIGPDPVQVTKRLAPQEELVYNRDTKLSDSCGMTLTMI